MERTDGKPAILIAVGWLAALTSGRQSASYFGTERNGGLIGPFVCEEQQLGTFERERGDGTWHLKAWIRPSITMHCREYCTLALVHSAAFPTTFKLSRADCRKQGRSYVEKERERAES